MSSRLAVVACKMLFWISKWEVYRGKYITRHAHWEEENRAKGSLLLYMTKAWTLLFYLGFQFNWTLQIFYHEFIKDATCLLNEILSFLYFSMNLFTRCGWLRRIYQLFVSGGWHPIAIPSVHQCTPYFWQ